MSENCNQNCGDCSADCQDRQMADFREDPHPKSKIRKVIGVVSGKGGVGKSMTTSLLAVLMQRAGFKTAVMDADITGPSIPKAFGLNQKARIVEDGLLPVKTKTGIDVMSINLLLEDASDPVVWRGPVIAGTAKQFWTDVIWGDIDVMFVDLPPGTGDVPLTVFQTLPLDGIIIVTTPQQLVSMVVGKAVKMAKLMGVPILGLVENMSYALCPDCGKEIPIFGPSRLEQSAREFAIPAGDRIPIDAELVSLADTGKIEDFKGEYLPTTTAFLRELLKRPAGES